MLPTLIVLLVMGGSSLALVRKALLSQWEQTVIARMQSAAHAVDMRLMRPKRLMLLFQEQTGRSYNRQVTEFILDRLRNLEGVVDVELVWDEAAGGESPRRDGSPMHERMGGRTFHRMNPLGLTMPEYDTAFAGETVSLVSEFKDSDNRTVGHIEVKISFFDLIDTMIKTPWWQNNNAYLVDSAGNVLTRTVAAGGGDAQRVDEVFAMEDRVGRKTLELMRDQPFGTVLGNGMPPDQVSSFYRLREAPWTMVMIVPGKVAFKPLLTFRLYYFGTIGLGILLALLFLRAASLSTARTIGRVSEAARQVARGEIGEPLAETRRDEVGELTRSFNIMTHQLQERLQLQQAMSVAREVQQNLLPQSSFRTAGIDACGCSIYCEETGGDYFDLLPDRRDSGVVRVVVGDVVGHGIGAALLMASIRAMVRCRTVSTGTAGEVIGDVNEVLCRDTAQTGNFVSLFYLEIDQPGQLLRWVRCGHDPAIVYDLDGGKFFELGGEGLVLGFADDWTFTEYEMSLVGRRLVVLLGSDGVWESENEQGDYFGKERVRALIAANREQSAEAIVGAITEAVKRFRGAQAQGDDITLVVVRLGESEGA